MKKFLSISMICLLALVLIWLLFPAHHANHIDSDVPLVQRAKMAYDAKQYDDALELYREGAEQGDAEAQFMMGLFYEEGVLVPRRCDKALNFYNKSANQNHIRAMQQLAEIYRFGKGVPQNEDTSIKWLLRAARVNGKGMALLGTLCYMEGKGVHQDWLMAMRWFQEAEQYDYLSTREIYDIMCELGRDVPPDNETAYKHYSADCQRNDPVAQWKLGACYAYGLGIEQNWNKAIAMYDKSAQQGYALAQFHLAECFRCGRGVPQDYAKAFELYQKAAEQGLAYAQYRAGDCLYSGWGVEANKSQGIAYLKRAANSGLALAQWRIGWELQGKRGCVPDSWLQDMRAFDWYLKAAEQGLRRAECLVGICYEYGVGGCDNHGLGVEERQEKALMWYLKAAAKGDEDALESVKRLEERSYMHKKLEGKGA